MFFKPLSPGTIRMYLCICCHYLSLETKYSATMQQCNMSSLSVVVLFVGHMQRLTMLAISIALWVNGESTH